MKVYRKAFAFDATELDENKEKKIFFSIQFKKITTVCYSFIINSLSLKVHSALVKFN